MNKRIMDLLLCLLLFPAWAIVVALVALLVWLRLGSPIFFTQTRPGLHRRPFMMYKFRTLAELSDERGESLPDAERMTDFGRWLRATSLDELPELWHVLRGKMSFVGPRPLLMQYLPLYSKEQARRHEIRPGITGWAQVRGRNALTWEERLSLDVWYVEHRSIWLDLRIIGLTILTVLRREGISQAGHATVAAFEGSPVVKATTEVDQETRDE